MTAPSEASPAAGEARPAPAILRWVLWTLDMTSRAICAAALTVMFFGLLANVLLRYMFGSGLQWAYDIHAILLPWMIAGGLVLATIYNRNLAISLLPDALTPRGRRILALLVAALTLTISAVVVWSSFPILRAAQYQRIAALGGISQYWGYLALIYGFAAAAVLSLCDIVADLMGYQLRSQDAPVSLS